MNYNSNAWVVMNNKLYGITVILETAAAWNLLPTPGPVIHVTCATRNSNMLGIVTSDNNVYTATVNICTSPVWVNTGVKAKSFNLWSDGEFAFIGLDNEQYRKRATTDKLPRHVSGAYPIVINDYNISYNSWGTYLGNDGKIYFDSNMHTGDHKNPKNWWTAFVLDVPGATSYAGQDNGVVWVVKNGTLIFTENFRAKDGGFKNVKDVGPVKVVSAGNNRNFIAVTTDNKVVWGNYDQAKGVQMNNLIDLNVSIPAFISSNSYASLMNSFSNPRIKDISTLNDGPASYIQRMAKSGITDFSPFKLLTLNDLVNIGKANKVAYTDPNFEGKGFNIWIMSFSPGDPYLPVGDCFIPATADINQVLCILVKNTSEYCTLIDAKDYKQLGHSWDRHDRSSGYTYNMGIKATNLPGCQYKVKSATTNTKTKEYKNTGNYLIGDVCGGGNQQSGDEDAGGNVYWRSIYGLAGNFILVSGLSIQNVNTTGISSTEATIIAASRLRPFVAVNPLYLTIRTDMDPKSAQFMNTYKPGNNMKDYWKIFSTSPFNTFAISPGGDINSIPIGFQYVDFLPMYMVAAICGDSNAIKSMGFSNKISPAAPINCESWMDTYMKMNNYENMKKSPVSDWCSQKGAKCDDSLQTFCTMGPNGTVYTKKDATGVPSAQLPMGTPSKDILAAYPNSILGMCGCFMPTDYAIGTDYNDLVKEGMSPKDAAEFMNLSIGGKTYQIPACYESNCTSNPINRQAWKNAPGGCRSVQICMNKSVIENAGNITGNINVKMDNSCQQNQTNVAAAAGPANTSNSAAGDGVTNVTARQNNINTGNVSNKGKITGDLAVDQQIKAEQSVTAANVDPSIALKAEEERKKNAKAEEDREANKRAEELKKSNALADEATKKQLASQGTGVVPPPPEKGGMSGLMIAIIIAVILILLGGGAFILLK